MTGENGQEDVMTSEELAAENQRLNQELRGALEEVERLKAEVSSVISGRNQVVTELSEEISRLTHAEKSDEEARFLFEIPGAVHLELQGEALFVFLQSFARKES